MTDRGRVGARRLPRASSATRARSCAGARRSRGRRSSASCGRPRPTVRVKPEGGRRAGRRSRCASACAAWPRSAASWCATRPARIARRGPRTGSRRCTAPVAAEPMRFWGWGDRRAAAGHDALPRTRRPGWRGASAARCGHAAAARGARGRAPAGVGAGRGGARRARGGGRGGRRSATTRPRASSTPRASRYPDLVRLRAGDAGRRARRRRAAAPTTTQVARGARGLRARWRGRRAVRRRDERRRRRRPRCAASFAAVVALDLGRLDALVERRRASRGLATCRAGHARPASSSALLARARLHARPLPAELRVRRRSAAARRRARPARPRRATGASTSWSRGAAARRAGRRTSTLAPLPASAAGPDLRELLVGSEGTLGVMTARHAARAPGAGRAPLRGRRAAATSPPGVEAFRALAQEGARPGRRAPQRRGRDRDVAGAGRRGRRAARRCARYLRARGVAGGCLAIVGWEGDADASPRRREATRAVLRAPRRPPPLGAAPGRAWAHGRFHGALPARRRCSSTA